LSQSRIVGTLQFHKLPKARRQVRRFRFIRSMRTIALLVNNTKKAERLVVNGSELMPGLRRNPHDIVESDFGHLISDQDRARTSDNHDKVAMIVPFQRRVTSGQILEVPKFGR